MTYFVSSWMRLVSTGWSPPVPGAPAGTVLVGRLGAGLSGGLGWVRVNGISTDRSLAGGHTHIIDMYYTVNISYGSTIVIIILITVISRLIAAAIIIKLHFEP